MNANTTLHAKTFPVSWDELHRHAKALAWRLIELGPWQGIVAVTRGGLVPAAIIARELDVRLIDTICVSSYEDGVTGGGVKGEVRVLKGIALASNSLRTVSRNRNSLLRLSCLNATSSR